MGPETMSVDELIELVKSHGYSVDALGNEDIYNLAGRAVRRRRRGGAR